jgi:hypothetical protein
MYSTGFVIKIWFLTLHWCKNTELYSTVDVTMEFWMRNEERAVDFL